MIDDEPSAESRFDALRRSIRALARAGSEQPMLFPEPAATPGDLAAAFDRWSALVLEYGDDRLTDVRRATLHAIAAKLATMSRDGAEFDAELWTDAAMAASEHWADVRRLAAAALDAFEWADDSAVESSAEEG